MIDPKRVPLAYFDPRVVEFTDLEHCGSQCSSGGACRDCGICISICPQSAISKNEPTNNEYRHVVNEKLCIGCGFCAGACPCGVSEMVENEPLE
jgi:ferredoxin